MKDDLSKKIKALGAAITLGSTSEAEAEAAFRERLLGVVEMPVEVEVLGRAIWLEEVELTPELGRIRAVIAEEHGRKRWRVSLDQVEFVGQKEAAAVVAAYRYWLGYENEETAAEVEAFESLVERIDELTVADIKKVSSWTLQEVAPGLVERWPEVAAKVFTALGWRHVDRGKSQYYDLSLEAFERARDLYLRLGQKREWEVVKNQVKTEHRRKSAFMPGFRCLE